MFMEDTTATPNKVVSHRIGNDVFDITLRSKFWSPFDEQSKFNERTFEYLGPEDLTEDDMASFEAEGRELLHKIRIQDGTVISAFGGEIAMGGWLPHRPCADFKEAS